MTIDKPINPNYSAVVVQTPAAITLDGLDNLVGVPVLGFQALTQNDIQPGELRVVFTAETQLSEAYARENNLHRQTDLNKDNEAGYLEVNRRVKAIRFRGHNSSALLMPLESLAYTGVDLDELTPGTQFDTLNGHEICRKYELPKKAVPAGKGKVEKAFKRVTNKIFPEHLETSQFARAYADLSPAGGEIVVTQKLHGTSIRVGNVPVLRNVGRFERILAKTLSYFGFGPLPFADYEFDTVYGSRHAIKDSNNPRQSHFYKTDIYTENGSALLGLLPKNYVVYGELIGWTPSGEAIQKGYTYNAPAKTAHLYVYRVAVINTDGNIVDLSWDAVKEFCVARGLMTVPELFRFPAHLLHNRAAVEGDIDDLADTNLTTFNADHEFPFLEAPVPLSKPSGVDEGICFRQEGVVPTILKAKWQKFFEHESKMLDVKDAQPDLESIA